MFCGHLDTVGVDGMTAPFDPAERDGCVFGRGAQDMKGGVAAMIHAAESVLQGGGLRKGRLIVAAVADEEYASAGADALVTRARPTTPSSPSRRTLTWAWRTRGSPRRKS